MNNEIIIGGALANCSGEFSTEDMLSFLKEKTGDVDYYQLRYNPGMKAALDWQAILGVTASSICIAQVLWSAYKKFIKPQHDKGQTGSFLYITMKDDEKNIIEFPIGTDITDEGEFVKEFSQSIEKIRISPDGGIEAEKQELKFSEHWKKI